MKKIRNILSLIALFIQSYHTCSAQVVFEHTYPFVNSPAAARPTLINMGDDNYKYMYIDYATNKLKLFNLDHTIYINLSVPIPLIDNGENTIGYVTRSLFDCDTTMFEYAILPTNYRNTFYIYRQDGTLLFQRDSSIGPYCFGCYAGSIPINPIVNTPLGAKLFLAKADSTGLFPTVDVYALCGSLPVDVIENEDLLSTSFVKPYPNPSTGVISFEVNIPDNINKYELVIYNGTGNVIQSISVSARTTKYSLTVLSSGIYFFSLNNSLKVVQTGKFIISL